MKPYIRPFSATGNPPLARLDYEIVAIQIDAPAGWTRLCGASRIPLRRAHDVDPPHDLLGSSDRTLVHGVGASHVELGKTLGTD